MLTVFDWFLFSLYVRSLEIRDGELAKKFYLFAN
jgi:hypothetical protein